MAMARRIVVALAALLLPLSVALERPAGCSEYRWTGVCAGFSITCESLAIAGLICGDQSGGVGRHGECEEACAEPCCITTTTTTQTMTTSTATATTATSTSSTATATTTWTSTQTSTTRTVTVTGSTVTQTTTTSVTTSSLTATTTSSTATTSTATMTTATTTTATMTTATETTATMTTESTTAGAETGPERRLVVRIKVTGVQDETGYVTDDRVSTAYREAMEEVTGLGKDKVDLQMVVTAPGNLTVSYILAVPEAHASSSMEEVKQSLMKETASSFSAKLQKHIDALVGHGHYTQQVVSMESVEDGAIGVSATEQPRSLWIAAMLAVTALSEIF